MQACQLLVEELLQRGRILRAHLVNTWARELLLAGNTAIDVSAEAPASETWLKLRFSANMPYDQMASELLTAAFSNRTIRGLPLSPLAFYQAAEFKPEQLASSVSKVFLASRCSAPNADDHPFAEWKQPQFWSFAAFFKNLADPVVRNAGDDGTDLALTRTRS